MRRTSSRIVFAVSFATILLAGACSDGTATPNENFTLALSATSLTLAQGASEQLSLTVQRDNFEKPIALSAEGLPQGVTVAFGANTLPATSSATTMNVTVAGNAAPTTSASFTVRAVGEGVADQTQAITLSVGVTGTYTLGLLEPELSVAQGGGGNATVLVTRTGANAGDVSFSVGTLPAGITAAFAEATTTGGAGALIIAAAADAPTGTYSLGITSSSPGHTPDQTTTLSLMVVTAPPTASANIVFCAADMPSWFAIRNEGFGWQQITPSGNTFSFNATDRVSLAFVFESSESSDLNIYHVQRSEVAYLSDSDCAGNRSYSGQVAGLTTGQSALVVMGTTADLPDASSPSYALDDLPDRPLDLVATRGVVTNQTLPSPDRIVARRGIDLATGSVIPELNFTAAESFAPTGASLTVTNAAANTLITLQNSLLTSTGTFALLQLAEATSTPMSLYFVPADKLVASDLHELYVDATTTSALTAQARVEFSTTPGDRSVTLGPAISMASVTTVAAATFARPRATFASQPEYSSIVLVRFLQSTLASAKFVTTVISSGYLGGMPEQWDVLVPDFSGSPGFENDWMLARNTSTQYLTQAFGGPTDLLFGIGAEAGESYSFAYRQSTATTSLGVLRAGARPMRRPTAVQYLRR